jgi:hypothetical protein
MKDIKLSLASVRENMATVFYFFLQDSEDRMLAREAKIITRWVIYNIQELSRHRLRACLFGLWLAGCAGKAVVLS